VGIDLNQLVANEATAVVNYMGQEAKVVYRPSEITARVLSAIDKDPDGGAEPMFRFIGQVVASWDLTKGDQAIDPKDIDAIRDLPMKLSRAVYIAILEDNASLGEADSNSNDG
jgi:hypothetical protein